MQWENMTAPDFARAVQEIGVCVIAFGVLEQHSTHLPLGTDYFLGHTTARLAAEKEPAVVFPPFYFGQIYEARCFPGTIALRPPLLLDLIVSVIDEIGRNGFKKIILYNAHGGNIHLLPFIAQSSLYEQKPYTLYLYQGKMDDEQRKAWEGILDTELHGHACECETSLTLAAYPDTVQMDNVLESGGDPLGRLSHVPGAYSGIWWYADYPEHYAGDARTSTREKGLALQKIEVDMLARFIKVVKEDEVTPALEKEFFTRETNLRS